MNALKIPFSVSWVWVGGLLALASVAAIAGPVVAGDNAYGIKGQGKVVIAEFGVEFYTQLHAEGRVNGSGGNGGANAQVTGTLSGVDDATLQAITDAAYANAVASLKQAGFEVLDPDVLSANADWTSLAAKFGADSPYTFTDDKLVEGAPSISKIFAPTGMKAFFSSSVARGDFRQRVDAQNQGRGAKEGDVARAVGATLLHLHYLASFGLVSGTKNNALFSGSFAHAAIDVEPVLWPNETEIQFVTSAGARIFTTSSRIRHTGAVYLKEPLIGAADLFSSQDATSAADKNDDAATNILNFAFGTGARKRKTLVTTPSSVDAYRAVYQSLLGEATEGLVKALADAR